MFYEGIAEYIEAGIDGLRIGRNLFVGNMPASAYGVMVKPGVYGDEIDSELPGMRRAKIQVVARDASYSKAKALADSVAQSLHVILEKPIADGQIVIKSLRQTREPYGYPNSAGNLYEFSVNFSAVYVIVTR